MKTNDTSPPSVALTILLMMHKKLAAVVVQIAMENHLKS